jgi:hypothetical protein
MGRTSASYPEVTHPIRFDFGIFRFQNLESKFPMNFMPPEQIAEVNALLQIIATPEAAKKRLDELVEQTKKLEAADKKLLCTQSVADIRDELASRENMLAVRQAAVEDIEANQKVQREAIAAALA